MANQSNSTVTLQSPGLSWKVLTYVAEAELGTISVDIKEECITRLILAELGHPQPPTRIHINNTMAVGIVNNTIEIHKTHSIEMRYFWLLDQATQHCFRFFYHPGADLLADHPTKAHIGPIHTHVQPYYYLSAHEKTPTLLVRTAKPSTRRGCIKILLCVWGQEINSNVWNCLSPNFQNSAFYLVWRNAREACAFRQIKNNRFRDREPNWTIPESNPTD